MADTFEDVLQIPEGATGELPQLVLQLGFHMGLFAGCGMGKEELICMGSDELQHGGIEASSLLSHMWALGSHNGTRLTAS